MRRYGYPDHFHSRQLNIHIRLHGWMNGELVPFHQIQNKHPHHWRLSGIFYTSVLPTVLPEAGYNVVIFIATRRVSGKHAPPRRIMIGGRTNPHRKARTTTEDRRPPLLPYSPPPLIPPISFLSPLTLSFLCRHLWKKQGQRMGRRS